MKEAIIVAVFKCKMCGGALEILSGESVAVCEYCNTKQTVPAADDEKKINLFMRANRLRFVCEFDKAAGVYESIVADFPEESEAYWGLLLCQYGIEYVDDPLTAKKIPTCHRSSFESVFDNDNFELVMEYSDSVSRAVYRDEAKQIEELRKGIIEVSAKESPYDIFICYKETADNGERTIDSVIAQDIYNELTERGYRVFFSRITLEDKLGQEYEPYIFAALNSAKLMLVFGTDYEYFNAVWVKNEWSRFLQLIAKGEKKTLIPCYKNIDAYDMPKEFAKLQAQDMGKVGAVQDLLRGIEKIIKVEKAEQPVYTEQVLSNAVNTEPLLRRAFMFLEDGDFRSADEYCEKVLDADPENVNAYIGKLMAETGINKRENLRNAQMPFDKSNNYQKILRFGDDALKKELTDAVEFIYIRKENERIEGLYTRAVNVMKYARIESAFREAAQIFESVLNYKDSAALAKECYVKAEEVRKDSIYNIAVSNMMSDQILKIEDAKEQFISIRGWKDSEVKIAECDALIVQIEAELEVIKQELQDEKKKDIIWHILVFILPILVIAICVIVFGCIENVKNYDSAIELMENGEYAQAQEIFDSLGDYKDSKEKIEECKNKSIENLAELIKDENRLSVCDFHIIGLKSDGTVVATGSNEHGQCDVSEWTDIIAVSTGTYHTVGLKKDGSVVATGVNEYGECNVSVWKDIIAVEAANCCTFGLKKDGTVIATGMNAFGQCDVSGWKDIISVTAGDSHTVGLKKDGTVVSTGNNSSGQCDVSEWSDIVAVVADDNYTVGLKSDGTVVATGYNARGRCDVSDWTDIVAVDASYYQTVGLKSDGTVVLTDDDYYKVADWTDIVAVAVGDIYTVGLKSDGTVVARGDLAGIADVRDWDLID